MNVVFKESIDNDTNDSSLKVNETVSDDCLPLGRAMHLLLNVKGPVFDRAVEWYNDKTSSSLVVKALHSLDTYLSTHSFSHIFEPLSSKILMRDTSKSAGEPALKIVSYFLQSSRHSNAVVEHLLHAMTLDKYQRSAAVLVVDHVVSRWDKTCDPVHVGTVSRLIPTVAALVKDQPPVLLSCSASNVVMKYAVHALKPPSPPKMTVLPGQRIEMIDAFDTNDVYEANALVAWQSMHVLLAQLEKWHEPSDDVDAAAWEELKQIPALAQDFLSHRDNDNHIRLASSWQLVTRTFLVKTVLAKKPMTIKKWKSLIGDNQEQDILNRFIKVCLFSITQRGRYSARDDGTDPEQQVDDDDLWLQSITEKLLIPTISAYPISRPFEHLGKVLIPQLLMVKPLYEQASMAKASLESVISWITCSDTLRDDQLQNIVQFILAQWCAAIPLLIEPLRNNDNGLPMVVSSIRAIISQLEHKQDFSTISNAIASKLRQLVPRSNLACELLVQLMPFLHLPTLVHNIMKDSITTDARTNHVCRALIAKALLVEKWASTSVLVYVDFIRYMKVRRTYIPLSVSIKPSSEATPGNIGPEDVVTPAATDVMIPEQDIDKVEMEFLSSIELWSRKATQCDLEDTLEQLVYKSYGLPNDVTMVHVWKVLGSALVRQPDLVWAILRPCAHIMTDQPSDDSDAWVFHILSPLLIFQALPPYAFASVELHSTSIPSLPKLDIHWNKLKLSQNMRAQHATLSKTIFDLLVQRATRPHPYTNINTLACGLVSKIFCSP